MYIESGVSSDRKFLRDDFGQALLNPYNNNFIIYTTLVKNVLPF